ncbi:3-deoxy-D-manno-octulosonic acid transferase [Granulicella mallensis]|uniref:3-deoxy-D-manno-octulosonic acid transferase n=1 Tax=Granulicella mallensis (strain ATCC BAA-1857 / DSM 23137 / MP5ACTX8) TaxID=682795 RepID=G8NPE5_GRAMM|nr:3-deoxy-D-manno-octulosonic acid transferase [Granulicella mallensis]AEU34865.1 Three-deoxy-D-manno-octulosonic-acid transferase domain-containing protein [Granulicella mallensis MP5ACTX8]
MLAYSLLLTLGLLLSSPWWLLRMATTERYREGLRERLGGVPARLCEAVRGKRVIWVHAVSVGEVLAASRLVGELEAALGEGFRVVVSTTTRTGQALARERFGAERVFYMPLDFAWMVRRYLQALKPEVLLLMESELWPRMLHECARAGVPVAVVNARVSDRSFARTMTVRDIWQYVLRKPSLWLAQSEEDARRLIALGAWGETVKVIGNLKYDVRAPRQSRIAELIREAASGRPVVVAGSTVGGGTNNDLSEEEMVIQAWEGRARNEFNALLVLAPRHPERFGLVESAVMEYRFARASDGVPTQEGSLEVVLLDTIGDLASVYGLADIAFVGGSLIKSGGHNPLEPAQFGVPVVMGPSFENFRDVVGKMRASDGICIVQNKQELELVLVGMLKDREAAQAVGQRGRQVFEDQQGATARSVEAIVAMVKL